VIFLERILVHIKRGCNITFSNNGNNFFDHVEIDSFRFLIYFFFPVLSSLYGLKVKSSPLIYRFKFVQSLLIDEVRF